MRDGSELGLVLRIGLDAQRGCEDELADGGAEAGEEGIEWLDVWLAVCSDNDRFASTAQYNHQWSTGGPD
jgi:hypothetical protein